jgi:hypothetical protein
VNILERRRYSKEIDRFADRYVSAYVQSMTKTPAKTPTMTTGDVRSGVRAIAQAHQMDERIVAADILDVVNKWVEKNVRLGPSGMKVPRFKTPRELGTVLPTETCHCPYCGYAADISEFTTPEQEEYVRSVGMREAQERILKPMMRRFGESLKGIERVTSRGPIQIRVEVRDQWRSIPLALYLEREVETDVKCRACGLQFAVYGVFATCPDCTGMNASVVFLKSMEAARRRLSLLDGDLDSGMVEGAERRSGVRSRGV